jgi:hypothetical protein
VHLGTTDVDVMLTVHVDSMASEYQTLEDALNGLGCEPSPNRGWRWLAPVDERTVKVEFLCDLEDQPNGAFILADGCSTLGAINLRGTRYVTEDYVVETLDGELMDGRGTVQVQVRRAGLAGYLVAKAHAITGRALQKDYYDFAYVLLHNSAGGPEAAAMAIRVAQFSQNVVAQTLLWNEIGDRYSKTSRVGPRDFARESLEADPTSDEERLKEDAVSAVEYFLATLRGSA